MLKTKTKVKISVAGLMLAVSAFLFNFQLGNSFAAECTTPSCDTTFQVNVKDTLSVSITAPGPGEWASGDAGEFLRNLLTLPVVFLLICIPKVILILLMPLTAVKLSQH